ncbi:VanZ family protein [Paenibacillus sp. EC2-1]|uniref:VanZ family protein n=1 Tax=Paenibacillus sp. EC2-1 TaxID=3388665 RepID=UPI003BEF46B5
MYQGKSRKIVFTLLGLYTLLTLFFLFLGFNRASINPEGLRYSFIPSGIPLHFPMGKDFHIWFFEWGNFLAFIPYGILIPLLFRTTFIRFISLFVLCITILETIQMFTGLGAFDIDDIIINTIGAAAGYVAQRIVSQRRNSVSGMLRILLNAILISASTIILVGGANYYLENGGGDTVALNEVDVTKGTVLWDESLTGFTAAQSKIEPKINLYSHKNTKNNEFSFLLNGEYTRMEGYVAIPNDVDIMNGRSDIIFEADGSEIYSIGLGDHQPDSFQIPLQGVEELTVKFISDGPNRKTNIVIWDTTLTEANVGQKLINNIRSLF